MASARKIAANRANARRSTGPRTAEGRARSARNAARHGLCAPVLADPSSRTKAVALAGRLGGPIELALAVAGATLEVQRVRERRDELLVAAFARDMAGEARAPTQPVADDVLLASEDQHDVQGGDEMMDLERLCCEREARVLGEIGPELLRLDSYERRALSRQKSAIRAFDEAQSAAYAGGPPPALWVAWRFMMTRAALLRPPADQPTSA